MTTQRSWLEDAKTTTDPSDELGSSPQTPEERPQDEEGATTHFSQVQPQAPPPAQAQPEDDTVTSPRVAVHSSELRQP